MATSDHDLSGYIPFSDKKDLLGASPVDAICQLLRCSESECDELKEVYIFGGNNDLLERLRAELKKPLNKKDDKKIIKRKKVVDQAVTDKADPSEESVDIVPTRQNTSKSHPPVAPNERLKSSTSKDTKIRGTNLGSQNPVTKPRSSIPCGFITGNDVQVFIHKCDITKLQVDAIVNAANEFLKHGGGVAKAIAEAAGPQLESEGREIINNSGPVPISNNVITSAGRLPCRKVIHAVGPRWPSEHDEKEKKHCLKMLHDTFINIILTADKEGFESLAMPAVGSGKIIRSSEALSVIIN